MLDCRCRRLAIFGMAALLAGAVFALPAEAQQIGTKQDADFLSKNRDQFNKLRDGEIRPDANDNELLRAVANYYVGRLTWQSLKDAPYASGMGKIQDEFSRDLMGHKATLDGKNKEFMKLLVPEVISCLDKVLKPANRYDAMAVTNASLMLPVLARCKQPAVYQFLLDLTKTDATGKPVVHPYVRMSAVKGLGVLNGPEGPKVDAADDKGRQARELARVDALAHFIDQPYPPDAPSPETDGAYVFARREGVKALAQLPVVALDISKNAIKGPVAYHLLKVAAGEPVKSGPPYHLTEKLEAALGLCQAKAADLSKYNAELTAHVLAQVLIDFAKEYKTDSQYFQEKNPDGTSRVPRLPWKIYALRLEAGIGEFLAGLAAEPAAQKKAADLQSKTRSMLNGISNYKEVEVPRIQEFAAQRPALTEVYKGITGFALTFAEK